MSTIIVTTLTKTLRNKPRVWLEGGQSAIYSVFEATGQFIDTAYKSGTV